MGIQIFIGAALLAPFLAGAMPVVPWPAAHRSSNLGEYIMDPTGLLCPGEDFELTFEIVELGSIAVAMVIAEGPGGCHEQWGPLEMTGGATVGWTGHCGMKPSCPILHLGPTVWTTPIPLTLWGPDGVERHGWVDLVPNA